MQSINEKNVTIIRNKFPVWKFIVLKGAKETMWAASNMKLHRKSHRYMIGLKFISNAKGVNIKISGTVNEIIMFGTIE